jgi:ABC-2 type transport system permease protein
MPKLLRLYVRLVRMAWIHALEYRAQAVLWVVSSLFPLVMLAVWLAVVAEAGPLTGWTRDDFIAYYVGAAVVNQLTFAWTIWEWDDDIRTGELSTKLLKPIDPLHHYVSEQLGWKLFMLTTVVPLVALAAWLSPALNFNLTPVGVLLAALAIGAGLALNIVMASAFGMIAFWSTQSANVYSLWWGMGQFLSGWIAPLTLFPPAVRQVAYWLPFRSLLGFPTEALIGRLSPAETAFGLAVTLGWILFFLLVYRGLWRLGLRRYEAVGA